MRYEYQTLAAGELPGWAATCKREGWQFVQMCAARVDAGIDLLYTLRRDDAVQTRVVAIDPEEHVPSVTGHWLAAFVFENEAHDLFGVQIDGIAIDFQGNFYRLAQEKPMMVMSPAQLAEREKAAKIKAAQEAKKAREAAKQDETNDGEKPGADNPGGPNKPDKPVGDHSKEPAAPNPKPFETPASAQERGAHHE